jgi:hypothetical protein
MWFPSVFAGMGMMAHESRAGQESSTSYPDAIIVRDEVADAYAITVRDDVVPDRQSIAVDGDAPESESTSVADTHPAERAPGRAPCLTPGLPLPAGIARVGRISVKARLPRPGNIPSRLGP